LGLLGLILLVAISLCWKANAETSSESIESSESNSADKEILDVQTEEELRSILSEVWRVLPPSDCNSWNEDEPRVATVMNLGELREFWIGREYAESEDVGIDGLQKRYEIKGLFAGGDPLRGSITVRLPAHEMEIERPCFSKLKDVQVRWVHDDLGETYRGEIWQLTIKEVNFAVLVKPQGFFGKRVPTDETQVTLIMSEGLVAMALRKSAEHLWALPGSLGLLMLWAVGRQVLRRMQVKWRARSTSDPSA